MTDYTVLIALTEASEQYLHTFRQNHILTPASEVPAHITIYAPFVSNDLLNEHTLQTLTQIFNQIMPFSISLHETRRFPNAGVLYLEPAPTQPLEHLHQLVQRAFPDRVPTFSPQVMHLTVAQGYPADQLDLIEAQFHSAYGSLLPLHETIQAVALYVKSAGRWSQYALFPFRQSAAF